MTHYSSNQDLLPYIYGIETELAGISASFGYTFSPVLVAGQAADPGIYNLPTTTPVTTESGN
jgi:hypothetical protein